MDLLYTFAMLNLNSLMLGTMQLPTMFDFYKSVFQKEPDMIDGKWYGWMVGSCFFGLGEHSEMGGMAKDGGRVMFNLETKEVGAEFTRIEKLGAKVVKAPYKMGESMIATLADPDGNYFQLMTPWEG